MSATEEKLVTVTKVAGADLSAAQYRWVKLDPSNEGAVILCGTAGENAIGILQNNPGQGQAATIAIGGISFLVAGGALNTIGTKLTTTNNGRAAAAASGNHALAIQETTAGAAGTLIQARIGVAPVLA